MALDFAGLSPEEWLAAESAVLTMRSLMRRPRPLRGVEYSAAI